MKKIHWVIVAVLAIVLGVFGVWKYEESTFVSPLVPPPTPAVPTTTVPTPAPAQSDFIHVFTPLPESLVSGNSIMVTGEARGTWYFEASFPVRLVDSNGIELGHGVAQTQGDWMTTNFVPFRLSLTFTTPTTATGTLILKKDNPSGLPQNDAAVMVPVRFDILLGQVPKTCVIGGCSGEICSDAADGPAISNCIYKAEFACYKTATCERQKNGTCGWTQTTKLQQCLKNAEGLKAVL